MVNKVNWKSDLSSNQCYLCKLRFKITRRRHHCRNCGELICSKCSKYNYIDSATNATSNHNINHVRVCDICFIDVSDNDIMNLNTNNTSILSIDIDELSNSSFLLSTPLSNNLTDIDKELNDTVDSESFLGILNDDTQTNMISSDTIIISENETKIDNDILLQDLNEIHSNKLRNRKLANNSFSNEHDNHSNNNTFLLNDNIINENNIKLDNLENESKLLSLNDDIKGFQQSFQQFIPREDWISGRWLKTGDSIYGIVLAHALMFMDVDFAIMINGCLYCFQQCIMIGGLQAIILYQLWIAFDIDYDDGVDKGNKVEEALIEFCSQSDASLLRICVIFIFIISMIPPFLEIVDETCIVITAKLYFRYDPTNGQAMIKPLKRSSFGVFVASTVVIYQFLMWLSTFVVGLFYILTSIGVTNIVQNAVAITFIMHLDNMCLFLYGKDASLILEGKYRTDEVFYKFPKEYTSYEQQKWFSWTTILPSLLVFGTLIIMRFIYANFC